MVFKFLKCLLNQYSHCPLAWWMGWKSSSCTISYGVEEEEEGDPGRSGHSMLVVVCCWSIRPGCSVSQKTALGLESASRRDGWVPCHCVSGNALVAIKDRTHLGEADPVQLTNTKKNLCRSPFLNRAMIFPPEPEPERWIPDNYQATDEKLIMTASNKQTKPTTTTGLLSLTLIPLSSLNLNNVWNCIINTSCFYLPLYDELFVVFLNYKSLWISVC